ncbi:MAG: N-acetylmuramic acid 6-phosphate etherase [Sulfobacillus sp.]
MMPYLEDMNVYELVQYLNEQDKRPQAAVAHVASDIAQAIEAISQRLQSGGRVRVVGAGTSGRLAQLDASELPPTFGIEADLWQTLMAGGREAFWDAVEGAEDNAEAGYREIMGQSLGPLDVVIGVAASGSTPYVQGALDAARESASLRVGIFCVDDAALTPFTDIAVLLSVGEESLRGSTRMLAGTAQKMVLNMISTGVMVQLGHTLHNLMIDMKPTNLKLRRRGQAIVSELLHCDESTARNLLEAHNYHIRAALIEGLTGAKGEELENHLKSLTGPLGSLWRRDKRPV